ncbi:MAG: DUF502 domain-containing protein [Bacteroidetes bacterium]|nr:DUF502 domain-containing protein [Bacteroidota bacterium]MBU1372107.1 DUF502 domain-containing protein [Bacteroidota bacterium]MBU1484028.1 DUF502 domain-containing protein [Bacteroidota bacterium]MBU1761329.1 DUF502 domain-containing protein [Bacteroidota bacterium]MBU2268785.1 DUF502 domain-containing protein [Bacteroidota bacterium]
MKRILSALFRYFIKGLLVVIPLGAAFFLLFWAFSSVDDALNLSDKLFVNPQTGAPLYIPGIGILSVILVILVAGFIATYLITEPIYNWFSKWLNKLPLFKFIYSSIKDLTEAFVGDDKKLNEPVLVEDKDGFKRIGFLTQKDMSAFGLKGEVAVYFPWSYSFAGQVFIVKADQIKPLKISSAQAMKFIISGGVSAMH